MSVMAEGKNTYILKATCKAAIGTVARISTFLAERRCYIMEMAQFDDVLSGRFFVRVVFSTTPGFFERCGGSRRARCSTAPSWSTTPPSTLVPPMSMPMLRDGSAELTR